jgi:hypothetical protein
VAGKLFTSSLNIPRRMFEAMIEESGSFHIHPFFPSDGGGVVWGPIYLCN